MQLLLVCNYAFRLCAGAPALTTRGFTEADFERVVELLDKGVKIALGVQKQTSELSPFWLTFLGRHRHSLGINSSY